MDNLGRKFRQKRIKTMRVWLFLLSLQPPHYQAYDVPLFYRDDQPETAVRKLLYLSTNKDVRQLKGTKSASWYLNIPIAHVSYKISVNRRLYFALARLCLANWGGECNSHSPKPPKHQEKSKTIVQIARSL